MTNFIDIRCIRKENVFKSCSEDDVVRIQYLEQNRFSVAFVDATETTGTVGVMDERTVMRFVRSLIHTLYLEKGDPRTHTMQLNFPLLPSMMFNVSDLGHGSRSYRAILDAVEVQLAAWKFGGEMRKMPQCRVDSFLAPPGMVRGEEEEEEYADMPELIRM